MGKFIVFEGLDGSGKTTLIQKLQTELKARNLKSAMTREPGGSPLGEEVRKILLRTTGDTPVPRTELLLYEAIRAQHVETLIRPTLKNGTWVLCDRYKASTMAFQAAGRTIDPQVVEWLNTYATDGLNPDLTVLLDLTVSESRKRLQGRENSQGTEADRFEREAAEFHEKVRQSYLTQAKTEKNWLVLDAGDTPENLFRNLTDELKGRQWL